MFDGIWPNCTEGFQKSFLYFLFYLSYFADIICDLDPPSIPHDDEYNESLNKDDGRVTIQHYIYPDMLSPQNGVHLSSFNQSEIPKNFDANLTFVL